MGSTGVAPTLTLTLTLTPTLTLTLSPPAKGVLVLALLDRGVGSTGVDSAATLGTFTLGLRLVLG